MANVHFDQKVKTSVFFHVNMCYIVKDQFNSITASIQ